MRKNGVTDAIMDGLNRQLGTNRLSPVTDVVRESASIVGVGLCVESADFYHVFITP